MHGWANEKGDVGVCRECKDEEEEEEEEFSKGKKMQ